MGQSLLENISYSTLSYGSDELQRIGIYSHDTANQSSLPRKWIIFIHGGAWRDPNNDHQDGNYIISSILKNHPLEYRGASIDYPLSNVSKNPDFALNTLLALEKIDKQFQIDEYILVGHSAGAFIALQTFMYGRLHQDSLRLVKKCQKVFGVEGIYILDLLLTENPGYRGFVEEAFGENKSGSWDDASPFSISPNTQRYQWSTDVSDFTEGSSVVPFVNGTLYICYSETDELLVEKYQPKVTYDVLTCSTKVNKNAINVVYCKIAGLHEEAIKREEIVNVIEKYI